MMKRLSLAEAKARISELVDQAEHHGKRVIILRHGKPAAALVPVHVALPKAARAKPLPAAEAERSVRAFIEEFSAAEPDVSAVADLIAGRR
jgi:prevent-host-death family protein